MALSQYKAFLKDNKVLNNRESVEIKVIGQQIAKAAQAYFAYKGAPNYLSDYAWEYNLVENSARMPGACQGEKLFFIRAYFP